MTPLPLPRRDILKLGAGMVASGLLGGPLDRGGSPPSGSPISVDVQLIRNATLRIRIGGKTLLVDPYLADQHQGRSYAGTRRSPLVPLPMSRASILEGVDAVFVSHLHSDHFDEVAREVVPKDLPILCPAALETRIREAGFRSVQGIPDSMDWHGTRLRMTGGRHGPDAVLPDMGPVNGFTLSIPGGLTLYWVGDSILCPEVQDTIQRHRPDVMVVHGCGATWQGKGPLVMDERQIETLLRSWTNGKIIVTHLDCVDHATVSRADLRNHFANRRDLMSRLVIPEDGDILHSHLGWQVA